MCDGFVIVTELDKLIMGWNFVFVDAKGNRVGYYSDGGLSVFFSRMLGRFVLVLVSPFTLLN